MRPLVLILALAALLAPAHLASIPNQTIEKKLDEVIKETLNEVPLKEPEQIDQANTIKDIDNQLKKVEPIPVKVLVEDVQSALKAEYGNKDEVKRAEVDLKHPGEPQRQEHETQNPEHYDDDSAPVATIKQMIKDTQAAFNDRFKDVSEHVEEWLNDNKPDVDISNSIRKMQDAFMENINKLNSTMHSLWSDDVSPEKKPEIEKVQSGLKVLEEKFENGVQNLNVGVRNIAVLKHTRDDASPTTGQPGFPGFPGIMAGFWTQVTQGLTNVTNQVQNIFSQSNNGTSVAAGVQSDETVASTSKPNVFQAIQSQIQGIFQGRPQGAQSDEQPQQTGPFAQVIQNVPLLQNFVNFIQPNKPSEPNKVQATQSTNIAGSNFVPAASASSDQQQKQPDEAAPASEPQVVQAAPAVPATQAPAPQGPLQQIIQKNPIVQGIAGAVQKIQHTITNPEKPREEVQKEGDEKAGFFPYWGHGNGHRPQRPADGHNNDIDSSGVKSSVEAEKPAEAPATIEAVVASPEAAPAKPEAPASDEAVKKD